MPTITALISQPGQLDLTAPGLKSLQPMVPGITAATQTAVSLSLGLVIDNSQLFWGECQALLDVRICTHYPDTIQLASLQQAVTKLIEPLLIGRPLSDYRTILAEVDAIRESAEITKVITTPAPTTNKAPQGALSRRDLLSGSATPKVRHSEPIVTKETIELSRPLYPALRYAVSQALLTAVAAHQQRTLAQLIAAEMDKPLTTDLIPLRVTLGQPHEALNNHYFPQYVGAVGYDLSATVPEMQMGDQNSSLQQLIRQLCAWLRAIDPDYRPQIYVNAQGGFGKLYNDNTGKILGAFSGMCAAAKPYRLAIENSLLSQPNEAEAKNLVSLKRYLRIRDLPLSLVSGFGINSVADVTAVIEKEAAHAVHFHLPAFGNLLQAVVAIKQCQEAGLQVILSSYQAGLLDSDSCLVQMALGVRADLLSVPLASYGRLGITTAVLQMQRTLAATTLS